MPSIRFYVISHFLQIYVDGRNRFMWRHDVSVFVISSLPVSEEACPLEREIYSTSNAHSKEIARFRRSDIALWSSVIRCGLWTSLKRPTRGTEYRISAIRLAVKALFTIINYFTVFIIGNIVEIDIRWACVHWTWQLVYIFGCSVNSKGCHVLEPLVSVYVCV